MENNFKDLPPLKRFRLIQQQQELEFKSLPAKKRKHLPIDSSPPPTYSLPAKKRVSAFRPFDLNLDYPFSEDDELAQIKKPHDENQENQENEDNVNVDDDDGIVCAVCQSTDADPLDPIVFCDGCDLMVHTTCYGTPLTNGVPEGDWFCIKCVFTRNNDRKVVSCCLCPETNGAMKRTVDNNWAHIVCALLVPEVFFKDPEGREGIDCTEVPSRRWRKKCYVCESVKGCVIECSEPKCPLAFHVTCGLKHELCIEYKQGKSKGAIVAGFCKTHTQLWTKVICVFNYLCYMFAII